MALFVEVKVYPLSGKQKCTIDENNVLKCFLKSPPEKGKANAELIKFLSKMLKVPQNHITIISGATYRKKRIKIEKIMTFYQFLKKLGLERPLCQTTIGLE